MNCRMLMACMVVMFFWLGLVNGDPGDPGVWISGNQVNCVGGYEEIESEMILSVKKEKLAETIKMLEEHSVVAITPASAKLLAEGYSEPSNIIRKIRARLNQNVKDLEEVGESFGPDPELARSIAEMKVKLSKTNFPLKTYYFYLFRALSFESCKTGSFSAYMYDDCISIEYEALAKKAPVVVNFPVIIYLEEKPKSVVFSTDYED